MQLIYFRQKQYEITIFFDKLQNQKEEEIGHWLFFFVETTRNEKFQKNITLLMEPNSDTK